MNLNKKMKMKNLFKETVSVPARGIMNLNAQYDFDWNLITSFRPRSGNYESELVLCHMINTYP